MEFVAELLGCVLFVIIGAVDEVCAIINKCLGSVVGC
jgi:hypothetical protein